MPVRVEAQLRDERVREFLSGLASRYQQISKLDRQVVGIMSAVVFRDVLDHFDKSQGPDGPWQKWSASYTARMYKMGKIGNKILIDSGRLRMNFQPQKYRVTGDSVVWFNNAKTKTGFAYSALHQYGGKYHPARPFMFLSSNAMDAIERQVLKFLEG